MRWLDTTKARQKTDFIIVAAVWFCVIKMLVAPSHRLETVCNPIKKKRKEGGNQLNVPSAFAGGCKVSHLVWELPRCLCCYRTASKPGSLTSVNCVNVNAQVWANGVHLAASRIHKAAHNEHPLSEAHTVCHHQDTANSQRCESANGHGKTELMSLQAIMTGGFIRLNYIPLIQNTINVQGDHWLHVCWHTTLPLNMNAGFLQ